MTKRPLIDQGICNETGDFGSKKELNQPMGISEN